MASPLERKDAFQDEEDVVDFEYDEPVASSVGLGRRASGAAKDRVPYARGRPAYGRNGGAGMDEERRTSPPAASLSAAQSRPMAFSQRQSPPPPPPQARMQDRRLRERSPVPSTSPPPRRLPPNANRSPVPRYPPSAVREPQDYVRTGQDFKPAAPYVRNPIRRPSPPPRRMNQSPPRDERYHSPPRSNFVRSPPRHMRSPPRDRDRYDSNPPQYYGAPARSEGYLERQYGREEGGAEYGGRPLKTEYRRPKPYDDYASSHAPRFAPHSDLPSDLPPSTYRTRPDYQSARDDYPLRRERFVPKAPLHRAASPPPHAHAHPASSTYSRREPAPFAYREPKRYEERKDRAESEERIDHVNYPLARRPRADSPPLDKHDGHAKDFVPVSDDKSPPRRVVEVRLRDEDGEISDARKRKYVPVGHDLPPEKTMRLDLSEGPASILDVHVGPGKLRCFIARCNYYDIFVKTKRAGIWRAPEYVVDRIRKASLSPANILLFFTVHQTQYFQGVAMIDKTRIIERPSGSERLARVPLTWVYITDVPFYVLPHIPGLLDRQGCVKESFEIPLEHAEKIVLLFEKFARSMARAFGTAQAEGSGTEAPLPDEALFGNSAEIEHPGDREYAEPADSADPQDSAMEPQYTDAHADDDGNGDAGDSSTFRVEQQGDAGQETIPALAD